MKKIFYTLLLLFSISFFSQNKLDRLEFDLMDDFESEVVTPMGKNGLLVQSFGTDKNDGQIELKNDFFSLDFKLVKTVMTPIKARSFWSDYYQTDEYNYTLIRNKRDYFAIVKTNSKDFSCTKVEGEYDDDATMTNMKVVGNKAYFKSVESKLDKIIIVDLTTGAVTEIPFKFGDFRKKDISILDYQVIDSEILVFVSAKTNRKVEDLYVAVLDQISGNQKEFYIVTDNLEEKIVSVAATKSNGKYILTGTYSKDKKNYANGIFLGEIEKQKLSFIKFYNFLDLKNFTNYLPEKKQDKIERKKDRYEEKGKELLMNYNIATHPITETADGYMFLGEAYYPVYITQQCGMVNNMPIFCQVFAGYQYTHATMAKFDKTGNLIWDNTFTMFPIYRPFGVRLFITTGYTNDVANLAFGNQNNIVSKSFNLKTGATTKDNTQEIIETTFDSDKVKRSFSSVEYWYDNYFVAYGFQVIKNSEEKRKKRVFFVNKITLKN